MVVLVVMVVAVLVVVLLVLQVLVVVAGERWLREGSDAGVVVGGCVGLVGGEPNMVEQIFVFWGEKPRLVGPKSRI